MDFRIGTDNNGETFFVEIENPGVTISLERTREQLLVMQRHINCALDRDWEAYQWGDRFGHALANIGLFEAFKFGHHRLLSAAESLSRMEVFNGPSPKVKP